MSSMVKNLEPIVRVSLNTLKLLDYLVVYEIPPMRGIWTMSLKAINEDVAKDAVITALKKEGSDIYVRRVYRKVDIYPTKR
jgi:hypothetical protein